MSVATSTAIIGGGILAAGGAVAASAIGAGAASSAGQAQLSAAQMQVQFAQQALQEQIKARQSGIAQAQDVSRMSAGEMDAIHQMLTTQGLSLSRSMASINQQQTQLNAMDPNVRASGQNLYSLLTGKSAEILAPMQKQIDYQRSQLVNQLSSQMGPGFMTSSAGIEALTKFDNQSALSLGQAQLQALQTVGAQYGSLAGMQVQGQTGVTGETLSAFQQAQVANAAALQAQQYGVTRETNATLGAMSANPLNQGMVPQAQQSVVQTAGNPFAGQSVIGQGVGQAGSALGAVGGQIAGMGMFSNMLGSMTNNGGVGNALSTSIGNYQAPNINPTFGSMIASGQYSGNLGANVSGL